MQVPSELKPAASGAVGDAIALAIVGFNRGGWVTDATASKTARDAADIAIVKVLAPTCAEMLQQQADTGSKMVELRKASAWDWSWPYPSVWMFAPNLCSTNEVASNCLQFTGIGPAVDGGALPYVLPGSVGRLSNRTRQSSCTKNRVRHQQEASTRPSRRGQNAQVFGVPEAVLQRLKRSASFSGLQVHRRLA
jgi:hypothetical protein